MIDQKRKTNSENFINFILRLSEESAFAKEYDKNPDKVMQEANLSQEEIDAFKSGKVAEIRKYLPHDFEGRFIVIVVVVPPPPPSPTA